MHNREMAKVFEEVAQLLSLKGEAVFKVRAYERVAETITALPFDLSAIASDEKRLRAIPGFGDAITKKVQEMAATGRLKLHEELKAEFPPGVLSLMQVPGIGPKTALKAAQELGIRDLAQLEAALVSGEFARLPRIGERNAANILRHLRTRMSQGDRVPIDVAMHAAERVMSALSEQCPAIRNLTFAGSLRRGRETIGDVDILCTADRPAEVIAAFASLPFVKDVIGRGDTKGSVVIDGGMQVDLRVTDDASFGALLLYFTGSVAHGVKLRERAQRMGMSLNEYGLTDLVAGTVEKFATEEEVYARLGLRYVPPEMREDSGEVEAAEAGTLPELVAIADIRGDLHSHTDWTDGKARLEQMAAAASARGLEYIAVTDHSRSQTVSRGLDELGLAEHSKAVRALDARHAGVRLLAGTEMDILPDGSLDYPDSALADLDVVLGSIHSAMDQDRNTMTGRLVRAMHNPHLDVVAHLTTRLIGRRAPVEIDVEAVFRAAVQTGTIMEINASTPRLDLKDSHIRLARDLGVVFAINTDSHSPEEFGQLRYGVMQARRGWCEEWRVVNSLRFDDFRRLMALPKPERYAWMARRD